MSRAEHIMPGDPVMALVERRRARGETLAVAAQTEATRINDFIYMSTGTSNSYMLLTSAGRVIINTGMGIESITHRKLFDRICAGPTPWIITTQGHVDHVGGVARFREPETRYIAQRNQALCQLDDARIAGRRQSNAYPWFQDVAEQFIKLAAEVPEAMLQDKPQADLLFDERHELRVGDLELQLIATPGGETIDSCVVWLPQHRILFSGNVFGPFFPHFPNINTIRGDRYRDITRYLESLEKIRALKPELLITGHGDPIEGEALIEQCLVRLRDAVSYVHEATLKGINAGANIHQLMRDIRLPPELAVGQGYGRVSWCVRTIWESYLGWFKGVATHELYPTQPHDLYADFARIAGPAALLRLGREKLDSDAVASTIVADVLLAADGSSLDARQLAVDAHRRLLEDEATGRNFWLRGWLKHQISLHEQAMTDIRSGAGGGASGKDLVAQLFAKLPAHFRASAAAGINTTIQFNVSDGSVWSVTVRDSQCRVVEAAAVDAACIIHIGERELIGLMTGTLSVVRLAFGANIRVDGDKLQASLLGKLFDRNVRLESIPATKNSPDRSSSGRIVIDDLRVPRLNRAQRALRALSQRSRVEFTEKAVLQAAQKRAGGLSDFGPDDFRERLGLLLQDYAADTNLSAMGRKSVFDELVRYAANRLLLREQFRRHPEIRDEQIEAPIIVAGLPRSGTTHLLNLLAADSRFRSLPLWLSREPLPLPGDARLASVLRGVQSIGLLGKQAHHRDPRWLRSAARWAGTQRLMPYLAAMHPMEPDHIHEELELMAPDFASYVFEWTGHVPRYRNHAYASDQQPHYEYMRDVLKLLQWRQPAKRWVLKCPQHLEQLPVLHRVFPDATIVVTHRDPVAVIQSTVTMLAYSQRMICERVDPERLTAYWTERIERLLQACARDRAGLPEAQSLDCLFHVFMADDFAMIEAIYAKAGVAMTDTARAELKRFIAENPRGKHGQVVYDLRRDFGVYPGQLRQRFQFYFDRFPVKIERTAS